MIKILKKLRTLKILKEYIKSNGGCYHIDELRKLIKENS